MASALHRVTKEYRRSVHTPDFPSADWIINPDLSSVDGWPSRYWSVTGDIVSLMDQASRDALDAAFLETQRDQQAAELTDPRSLLRALVETTRVSLNALRSEHGLPPHTGPQFRQAIRNRLDD